MKPKGRPHKPRRVKGKPAIAQFSPRGRPGRPDEVELKVEECEALRIADYQGLSHKEAADYMGISRQSFERVLKAARKTAAEGLTTGKIIKIHGGFYRVRGER